METMNNYNGVMLVVDLDAKECTTEDLSEELVEKALGGAAVNLELYEQYRDRDPLILGSGLLTATFAPLACCGVLTGKSPVTGAVAHVPFGWQTGVELKLTGFDFVVILGASKEPVRLWLHDGLSDIDESTDIWGSDVWESVDKIRESYGDDMIQSLLIGKAGENKVPISQVSENYWGSKDTFGFGAVFGEKNLKAVAMRGLGALEVADGFFQQCVELKNAIVQGTINGKTGLKDIGADLGIDSAVLEKIQSMTHRNNAGFNCPYPYYTFLKYREAPDSMAMEGAAEPGCLVSDLIGFAGMHAAGLDAAEAMETCSRLGLSPAAAASALKEQGGADISALENLASSGILPNNTLPVWPSVGDSQEAVMQISRAFSTAVPPRGIFASQSEGPEWWLKRQAISYILGLDPVIMLMTPEITDEKAAELVATCAEWDDFTAETLNGIADALLEKSKV